MKCFNTAGVCIPKLNYMADTSAVIEQIIARYVSPRKYFTIDRPRQCGKTTTLYLLEEQLKNDYIVLSLSFESADELFVSLYTLAAGFIRKTVRILKAQGSRRLYSMTGSSPYHRSSLLMIWDRGSQNFA